MVYSRWKLLSTLWRKLSNTQAWAERFATSRTLLHTGRLSNGIRSSKFCAIQGGKFLKTHPSEDLETALKALEIAEGSLEEVAEHYE